MKIHPTKLQGSVKIPPSKSMAHRAIICASLSAGESTITGIDYSEDIIATIEGMRALGATIVQDGSTLTICGKNMFADDKPKTVDCNESGSTLRFLVPISLVKQNNVTFLGKGNLGKRPLTPFYDIFDDQKIKYSYTKNVMDLHVEGQLGAATFELEGNISSQFISGLLFALPLLEQNSTLIITTPMESKGYIDLTLQMLDQFGIDIQNNEYQSFFIKGKQTYKSSNYQVEGDFSQAAFYLVAGAIGNDVTCTGLNTNSLQGDKVAIDFLRDMGSVIHINDDRVKIDSARLKGNTIDGAECPDIIPVMGVAASLAKGETEVINAIRLRIKECDRLMAISTELNKIGASIVENKEGMSVTGVQNFTGGYVSSHKDHRIAMSLAIATTCATSPIIIDYPECVNKSYPSFWEDYESLGGKIEWI
ncbi:MAG: 3-phosphoshikimate 1-carboxyvinyltransferase [Epulopiscium sp. Nele67-Bin004]|nr:MAG: 3-phosphoshikimate 1-carboxyvinyltransferase [Epulopiscium sp. Nele67-Bin004]